MAKKAIRGLVTDSQPPTMRSLTVIGQRHREARPQGQRLRVESPAPLDASARRSIADVLAGAQAKLGPRPNPHELAAGLAENVLVVDIRPLEQRITDGEFPGALVIGRNVLEWRLDPQSPDRIPEASYGLRIVVVCHEGFSSSLAAATLVELGLDATDLDGGVTAWIMSGHRMVHPSPTDGLGVGAEEPPAEAQRAETVTSDDE
ncbi:MAG: hypothetical protein NVS3B21_12700 [Acidimicrobiales bacterium]